MNTPYLWLNPREVPEGLVGSYDDEISPDYLRFSDAKAITSHLSPHFHFPTLRARLLKLDVLPNSIRIPLISQRVATLLTELCADDFQLIPATIKARDAQIDDYFLLNVLAKISGIDHANSIVKRYPGYQDIRAIDQLRYTAGAMGNHLLARESEYLGFLWTSDKIVQAFKHENFKGCAFQPPEYVHP